MNWDLPARRRGSRGSRAHRPTGRPLRQRSRRRRGCGSKVRRWAVGRAWCYLQGEGDVGDDDAGEEGEEGDSRMAGCVGGGMGRLGFESEDGEGGDGGLEQEARWRVGLEEGARRGLLLL